MPPSPGSSPNGGAVPSSASLSDILTKQLEVAGDIQKQLTNGTLDPKDYKDLITAANNIITMAHRTDESLRIIETYKIFTESVMEFLRSRSDQLGEDLVKQLKTTAAGLRTERQVTDVIESVP